MRHNYSARDIYQSLLDRYASRLINKGCLSREEMAFWNQEIAIARVAFEAEKKTEVENYKKLFERLQSVTRQKLPDLLDRVCD